MANILRKVCAFYDEAEDGLVRILSMLSKLHSRPNIELKLYHHFHGSDEVEGYDLALTVAEHLRASSLSVTDEFVAHVRWAGYLQKLRWIAPIPSPEAIEYLGD